MQMREGFAAAIWVGIGSLAIVIVTSPFILLYLQ